MQQKAPSPRQNLGQKREDENSTEQRQFRELTGLNKSVSWFMFDSKILKKSEQALREVKISNSFVGANEEGAFCDAEPLYSSLRQGLTM